MTDDTSRNKTAQGDERAQREWRDVFDAIGHPTVILDPDRSITASNRAVQAATGLNERQLLGKKCYEVFHAPDAAGGPESCPMDEMIRSGHLETVELELEAFGGWYLVSCTPLFDDDGRIEKIIHMATDISARKQAEEALRISEARHRELVDHMSSGVAVYEPVDDGADFIFRDFNEAGQRIEQVAKADVLGRRVTEVFPGVAEFGLLDVLRRVWRTGTPEHFPIGQYKDERIAGWRENFVYKLPSGEVVAVYDDVTVRKQAEQHLEHLNAVLRALRNVNQLITRETDRGKLLNGACENLVEARGYRAAWAVLLDDDGNTRLVAGSGLGDGFRQEVARAGGKALPPSVAAILAEPGVHLFTDPSREWDGWPVTAIGDGQAVLAARLAHGEAVSGLLAVSVPRGFVTDAEEQDLFAELVSDVAYALHQLDLDDQRRRAEHALAEREARLKSILRAAPVGIGVVADRILRQVNNRLCDMVGYSADELLDQSARMLYPSDEDYEFVGREKYAQIRERGTGSVETRFRRKDGAIINVILSSTPLDPGDLSAGVTFTALDITDRVRAEQALREQAEELARSNAELQQFAYVASHDLQEPLRKVTSYLQLLEERYKGKLDHVADEFIDFAVDGAARMKRLINDLLDYSRVGTRGRPFAQTDTNALLESVLADLQMSIAESEAEITHDALPAVMADSVQLGQVFQNLITNALKFRRPEPPRVHVAAERSNGDWVFSVTDNGIGIDADFEDRIFVMFQRLHGRGKYPGTGIGLALCKKIVERHGGRIWVEPNPDGGSIFRFTLPAVGGE